MISPSLDVLCTFFERPFKTKTYRTYKKRFENVLKTLCVCWERRRKEKKGGKKRKQNGEEKYEEKKGGR